MNAKLFLLLGLIVMAIIIGCLSKSCTYTETTTLEDGKTGSVEQVEGFFIFETDDAQEYLRFLKNFDEDKYEIIDISTGWAGQAYNNYDYYMVTYKSKIPQ